MLTVTYLGGVTTTKESYLDSDEIGWDKKVRKEHNYPEDFDMTLEECAKLAKPKTIIPFLPFIIRSQIEIKFSTSTKRFTTEQWRRLVAAVEKPEGEYMLLTEEDYPHITIIEAEKTGQVEFSSGGITLTVPKEACLEAFRKAQEDLEKYHNWSRVGKVHIDGSTCWVAAPH